MTESGPQLASEAFRAEGSHYLEDVPAEGLYDQFGYAIAMEVGPDGENVPEGGNTAIFRIMPRGLTEPVYVTKPETDATFTVDVVRGEGRLIRVSADGAVEDVPMHEGQTFVVHPGEAYTYKNVSDVDDLILHDVARPAFRDGDEAKLTESIVGEVKPEPKAGFLATPVRMDDGQLKMIELPERFHNLIAEALKG